MLYYSKAFLFCLMQIFHWISLNARTFFSYHVHDAGEDIVVGTMHQLTSEVKFDN